MLHSRHVLGLGLLLCSWLAPAELYATSQTELSRDDFSTEVVTEVAFEGLTRLSGEEVRYLVEQVEGELYDPLAVRRSAELLFRLGQFDDVQARVARVQGGVRLTFVLVPSPRIARIRIVGVRRLLETQVRAALSRSPGDPYIQQDEVRLARELEQYYRARGFLEVEVNPRLAMTRRGGKVIILEVDEKRPYRVAEIRFPPPEVAGFEERRLAQMLGPRLKVGRVFREEDLERGLRRLLAAYRRQGFVEARLLHLGPRGSRRLPVDVSLNREDATVSVSLPLDAGRFVRSSFRFEGRREPGWSDRRLREVVGLTTSQRVSSTYGEDAGFLLERFLKRRGYFDAKVSASLRDEQRATPTKKDWRAVQTPTVRVLDFDVKPGARRVLRQRDVELSGNEFLGRDEVIRVLSDASPSVIGHRPAFWVVLGLPIFERYYTEDEMKIALSTLRDYYRARGFLDAKISRDVSVSDDQGGAGGGHYQIKVRIEEGVRTQVEGLVFEEGLPLEERQLAAWRRRLEGRPFNPAGMDELQDEVRRALGERGYIDAEVSVEQEYSDDGTLVRLLVGAEEGDRVSFGKVLVAETKHTQVGVIRGEMAMRAGEVFRPSVLDAAQRRLLRTGLFDSVTLQAAQSAGRVRDVQVLSAERNRFSFLFGAGVTAPDDGPRLSGEARLRNLDGRGLSLWIRGRASIDWRYLSLDVPPRLEYRASVGLELPYIPRLPLSGTVAAVLNEELDEPTYRLSRSLASLSLAWRGSEDFTLDGRLEVQARAPMRVDPAAQLSVESDLPTDKPLEGARPLVLLGLKATVDKRDDRFNPSKGIYASAALDTTPGDLVAGTSAFGRLAGRFVSLLPVGDKGFVLQLEVGGGIIWSYNDTVAPVEWRFRLGGASSVRGFRRDSIGPTGIRPGLLETAGLFPASSSDRQVPVGGTAFYRYSLQLLLPLPGLQSWRFVVFHDAGNALFYQGVPDGIDSGLNPALHPSFGVGIRRITPIGPLRLDVGFAIANAKYLPDIPVGDFVQIHFAVGSL
jgi:outer membrane protein assembly complex protein YaeT